MRVRRRPRILTLVGALALGGAALVTVPGSSTAAGPQPCDIYASGGTPCVAAHSTTRALFAAYSGRLYQVRRASDNTTRDINALAAGGEAALARQLALLRDGVDRTLALLGVPRLDDVGRGSLVSHDLAPNDRSVDTSGRR